MGTATTLPDQVLGLAGLQARLHRQPHRRVAHEAAHREERRALGDAHEHVGRVVQAELRLAGGDELDHVGGPGRQDLLHREAGVGVVALLLGHVDGDVEHPRHPVHDQGDLGHLGGGPPRRRSAERPALQSSVPPQPAAADQRQQAEEQRRPAPGRPPRGGRRCSAVRRASRDGSHASPSLAVRYRHRQVPPAELAFEQARPRRRRRGRAR